MSGLLYLLNFFGENIGQLQLVHKVYSLAFNICLDLKCVLNKLVWTMFRYIETYKHKIRVPCINS